MPLFLIMKQVQDKQKALFKLFIGKQHNGKPIV